jgi:hypothetical protein
LRSQFLVQRTSQFALSGARLTNEQPGTFLGGVIVGRDGRQLGHYLTHQFVEGLVRSIDSIIRNAGAKADERYGVVFKQARPLRQFSGEPPRLLRRLFSLRGLSYEEVEQVLT